MFKEHDEVTVVSDDQWDGAVGVVVEFNPWGESEVRVLLEDEDTPLWFFFSELRKVGA
ncbi:hypothetical protein OIE82_27255 [Streptomyces althioticus]|uniref:DUF4926 domain-containing protein n=1 Tax=Streptomyces althioticus TaxID=83380 RepID=A0ABZ1YE33_9ACTN